MHNTIPIACEPALSQIERARADFYALMAALLLAPPSRVLLGQLAQADRLPDQAGELAEHWEKLVTAARLMEADVLKQEYEALFIGTPDPALNPYASWYLTGFLMEKPLAQLRRDLGQLGLARSEQSRELEDHLGALFETMRLLIEEGQDLDQQKHFFEQHIASWAQRFTAELCQRETANFYRVLSGFIDSFLALEAQAFAMEEHGGTA